MEPVFEEYMELPRRERIARAKQCASNIYNYSLEQGLTEEQSIDMLCHLTKLFVSVDRVCEQGEYDLFVSVTGADMTYDEFFELTNGGGNKDYVDAVLGVVKTMDEDLKGDVAMFGLCMCSADGDVTEAERMMIFRTLD